MPRSTLLPRAPRVFWRFLFSGLLCATMAWAGLLHAAPPPTMPVSELKPGMRGITYTVMQGTDIVPLETEVLGVAHNFSGPGLDLIICKLVDPKTVLTGAVHGMSGSPLYIDGRLVGALSRRIARFEKDGHCGYTPISDMLAVGKEMEDKQGPASAIAAAGATGSSTASTTPAARNRLAELLDLNAGAVTTTAEGTTPPLRVKASARRAFDCASFTTLLADNSARQRTLSSRWTEGSGSATAEREAMTEPLAIPLSVSGPGAARVQRMFAAMGLDKLGFLATPSGGALPPGDSNATGAGGAAGDSLKPGSAVAAVMMVGSMHMAGTGTLTWRDGNNILAFGHPMLSIGKSAFPMGTAEIITTIPSYERPYKMSNTGVVVGTIEQDRASAIAGEVGPMPVMAKYKVERIHNGQPKPTLTGEFARVMQLVPGLMAAPITASLFDNDDISHFMSVRAKGEIKFAGHPPLKIDGYYTGEEEQISDGVMDMVGPAAALYASRLQEIMPESVDVSLVTDELVQHYEIDRVATDHKQYDAGATVTVTADLIEVYGTALQRTFSFQLPENLKSGSVRLRIVGGGEMQDISWRRALANAHSIDELINLFNKRRLQNQLWVQVYTNAPGEIVGDQEMPALPPTVREVMQSGNRATTVVPLNELVWLEQSQEVPGVVAGKEDLTIQIK